MNRNSFLRLPPGSAGLFLKEAIWHQAVIDTTQQLYKRWGYTMVHTPMVDFFDAHSHLFTDAEEERLYRFIGRDGEILMLRSDITVFLLKHYQSLLKNAELPLRLAYSDSILRHEDSIDISRNEHYQTGVELIGNREQGREQELEILLLLCENLQALELRKPAIHIGTRKIFDIAFSFLTNNEDRDETRNFILLRDWDSVRKQLLKCNKKHGEQLIDLFSSIWEMEPTSERAQSLIDGLMGAGEIRAELDSLHTSALLIRRHFPNISVRIDLSEIGARHYYSGMAFQVYLPGIPYAVVSGGRYDRLLEEMGLGGSAVGYSMMLSALLSSLFPGEMEQETISSLSRENPGTSLEERYMEARKIRRKGKAICL